MASVVTKCPHCNTNEIALNVVYSIKLSDHLGLVYLYCPHCKLPSSARLIGGRYSFGHAAQSNESFNSAGFELNEIWPKVAAAKIPDSLPESVARAMVQAESNFALRDHEEAASVMYRKALELGLKTIAPDLKGQLASRIEQLGAKGQLTKDLVDWSKQIKNLGNDGAHESEAISRQELTQLRGLTDLVLQYLFTLPSIVNARRQEIDVQQNVTKS